MSFSEADLLSVIDKLYEAALDPALLDSAFQDLATTVGGVGINFLSLAGETLFYTQSLSEVADEYPEWALRNPRVKAVIERGVAGLCTTDGLLSSADFVRDPFYQEFLRQHGLLDFAAFISRPSPDYQFGVSVERAIDNDYFERGQLEFLAKIGPHASRALALSMRLRAHTGPPDPDLAAFVNRLDGGAIVIRRSGEVVALNKAAETLLGDGLAIQQKRLCASLHTHQSKLDRLLNAAFNQVIDNIGSLALPRPSGKRPLLLQAVPLAADYFPGQLTKKPGSVLILIFDLERGQGSAPASALQALGLSPAEISVAALIGAGLSPQEASDRLGLAVATVRTHIKNIYSKLDLQRQGDLVQLVTRLKMVK